MSESSEFLDLFIKEMKQVMDDHDIEKGCTWKDTPSQILVDNLFSEIHEFEIKSDPDRELIDIANSCYIIWAKRKFFNE